MEIRTLDRVSFEDGLRAWNDGFEGYAYAGRMTLAEWLEHLAHDEIAPEVSVIAFDGARPVGCVLSGMRETGGRKVAYNGGTGVAAEYRGKGVGGQLIEASLERYRAAGADVATLEVVTTNEPALRLYRRAGFEVADRLSVQECPHAVAPAHEDAQYRIVEFDPPTLAGLPFYRQDVPWQCQWQSVAGGRAVYLLSERGETLAYALVRRRHTALGEAMGVGLYQAAVAPGAQEAQDLLRHLVSHALEGAPRCVAMNIPASDPMTLAVLASLGFRETVAQFLMRREMRP